MRSNCAEPAIVSAVLMSDRDKARALSAGSWLPVLRPTFERYGRKPLLGRPAAGQPSRSLAAAGEEVELPGAKSLDRTFAQFAVLIRSQGSQCRGSTPLSSSCAPAHVRERAQGPVSARSEGKPIKREDSK